MWLVKLFCVYVLKLNCVGNCLNLCCAKIMCDKHGDLTCAHLTFFEQFGFSENGNFSLNPVQKLINTISNC